MSFLNCAINRPMVVSIFTLLAAAGVSHAALSILSSDSYSGDAWGAPPNNGQWHYRPLISSTDLINNSQSTLTSVAYTGSFGGGGGNISYLNNGQLTDNDAGYIASGATGSGSGYPGYVSVNNNSPVVVTYKLNTVAAPLGFDLTKIETFASWFDNRSSQEYTVAVEYVGTPGTYTQLGGTFSINNAGGQGQATHIALADNANAVFATGVSAIRFTLDTVDNWNGYREIDVYGVATVIPEPAAAVLGTFGLLTLLRRRR